MPYSAWAPLAGSVDIVLLIARLILGGTMVYYGWPKVKDPRKNAFDDIAKAGFTPGWFWGTIVLLTEFGGGLPIIVGLYTWVAAALIGVEMLTGTVWKITRGAQTLPGLFVRPASARPRAGADWPSGPALPHSPESENTFG